jgi:putative spermidine/putrescine transport system permease protein
VKKGAPGVTRGSCRRRKAEVASIVEEAGAREDSSRRLSAFLFRHRGLKLGLTLGGPLTWFLVIYLGSLGLLLFSAFWHLDVFTAQIVRGWSLTNFQTLIEVDVYRKIALRTLGIAAAVTVADVVLSFPLAYYAARLATPRMRNLLLIAVVLPLWANYLVRIFAWKLILTPNGFLNWLVELTQVGSLQLGRSNWSVWLTFVYLWLPFTLLPIYAALERVPSSFMEASADLGARGWTTFRSVVWPLILPGVIAGSIFSFSLTLGDYITPELVGNTQFIGNVIFDNVGVAGNIPLAAAYALVPLAIMAVYLLVAKRAGAFEAL